MSYVLSWTAPTINWGAKYLYSVFRFLMLCYTYYALHTMQCQLKN